MSRTKEKLQLPGESLSRACAGTDFARRGRVHSAVPEQPLLSRLTAETDSKQDAILIHHFPGTCPQRFPLLRNAEHRGSAQRLERRQLNFLFITEGQTLTKQCSFISCQVSKTKKCHGGRGEGRKGGKGGERRELFDLVGKTLSTL